jgi:hypothetical protein
LAFQCGAEIDGEFYFYVGAASTSLESDGPRQTWSEKCWAPTRAPKVALWESKAGRIENLSREVAVPPSTGLLALAPEAIPPEIAPVAQAFQALFRSTILVRAGVPGHGPETVFLVRRPDSESRNVGGFESITPPPRVREVVEQLVRWNEDDADRFAQVGAVLRRLRLCDGLVVSSSPISDGREFIEVLMDGKNLGFASDGTLRVVELVVALVAARPGAIVMLEEPETGIHPGLVDRLMGEFSTFAEDIHLIISTHDPRIVDHAEWEQIRCVLRKKDTSIRPLGGNRLQELKAFLSNEGTLGDFIFGDDNDNNDGDDDDDDDDDESGGVDESGQDRTDEPDEKE